MEPAAPSFTANIQPVESKSASGWNLNKILLGSGLVLLVVVVWTYISSPLVITVTGSGEVSVPATNATLSFTLSANDNSIATAVSSVQNKADTMRSFLRTKGVAEGDIAQSQVTAVPASLVVAGASGFQATVSMAAKTVNVSSVSGLVADLYTNGALVVAQPVLSVENQNKLNQEALDSAMKDARSQASKIGNSNWKFIRKIVSISQASSPSTSTSTTKADVVTSGANTTAATNGVFKIVKAVSVSYKMW
ncbi:MAG: SIMPL domain-containing protein [Patescibacteria group bacterium]